MKRILMFLLAAVMVLTLAACGGGGGAEPPQTETPEAQEPPPETPETPEEPPPEEPEPPQEEEEDPPTPEALQPEVNRDHELVGAIIAFGGYDWRVLDVQNDRALIITEYIIAFQSYYGCLDIPWYQAPPMSEMATSWADSYIRQFLNAEFFNSFSAEDRARIAETNVVNNDNPWLGTPGGADTTDRVFLLSIEEVVRYFGDSGYLENQNNTEPFAGFNDQYGESRAAQIGDGVDLPEWAFTLPDEVEDIRFAASMWWLRSPGEDSAHAAYVMPNGILFIGGVPVRTAFGVRPAMWIYLN